MRRCGSHNLQTNLRRNSKQCSTLHTVFTLSRSPALNTQNLPLPHNIDLEAFPEQRREEALANCPWNCYVKCYSYIPFAVSNDLVISASMIMNKGWFDALGKLMDKLNTSGGYHVEVCTDCCNAVMWTPSVNCWRVPAYGVKKMPNSLLLSSFMLHYKLQQVWHQNA